MVLMRHSLLVTCLLLTAWTDPAGKLIEQNPTANAAGVSVVEKSTTGIAVDDDALAVGPAETTKQLIEFDAVAIAPVPTEDVPRAQVALPELPAPLAGNSLAALDAVADGFDFTPARPGRAGVKSN